ncbi:hypothetical protein KI387_018784, partial [Taxus chinensis]
RIADLSDLFSKKKNVNEKAILGYEEKKEDEKSTSKKMAKTSEEPPKAKRVDFRKKNYPRRHYDMRYAYSFYGYCYACNEFGHKAAKC